jgi:RES domain-containing protein
VYLASSRSLAALEMAVHLDRAAVLASFVFISCEFDERLVAVVRPTRCRRTGATIRLHQRSQSSATRGSRLRKPAVLEIPSAIVQQETHYLLNPAHRDCARIRIGEPEAFSFDGRLTR